MAARTNNYQASFGRKPNPHRAFKAAKAPHGEGESMPSRIVREGILTSLKVDKLTSGAELFYRRLLNVIDDFGRYHGTPALLRAAAFPLKIDKVLDSHIATWLQECVNAGLIETYLFDGLPYIEVLNFGKPRASESKFKRLKADENKCLQTQADESNRTVVVVESVVVSETTLPDKSGETVKNKRVAYSDDFETFWAFVPTEKKSGKGAAFKAWQRLNPEDRLKAVDRMEWTAGCFDALDPGRQRIQYLTDPQGWLNQRKFEDADEAVELIARGK